MNKGELSEAYVLMKLLVDGKLYAADEDLNKMDDWYYHILEIIKDSKDSSLIYRINNDKVEIFKINRESHFLKTISRDILQEQVEILIDNLNSTRNIKTISEDTIDYMENSLKIRNFKASSLNKSDIKLKVHDAKLATNELLGFSIKSQLGSPSTLLNASKSTNFIFEISGLINDDIVEEFNNSTLKLREKLMNLFENNSLRTLNFVKVEDQNNGYLESNMRVIDSKLPEIIAEMLLKYYIEGLVSIAENIDKISQENKLGFDMNQNHQFYKYKVKKFLSEIALGMMPSMIWEGITDATGGYIIVKDDGDIVCYHLFNRNRFESYLVDNTRFETASTTRHKFGHIYKSRNNYFIKLNLQIRFIK